MNYVSLLLYYHQVSHINGLGKRGTSMIEELSLLLLLLSLRFFSLFDFKVSLLFVCFLLKQGLIPLFPSSIAWEGILSPLHFFCIRQDDWWQSALHFLPHWAIIKDFAGLLSWRNWGISDCHKAFLAYSLSFIFDMLQSSCVVFPGSCLTLFFCACHQ